MSKRRLQEVKVGQTPPEKNQNFMLAELNINNSRVASSDYLSQVINFQFTECQHRSRMSQLNDLLKNEYSARAMA